MIFTVWNPPRFTLALSRRTCDSERVVPFWSYFYSRSLADLADVIGQVADLHAPWCPAGCSNAIGNRLLGALLIGLALRPGDRVWPGVPSGRSADISDAISAAAGAPSAGWALWRWGEWTRTSSMGDARYRVGRPSGLKA